MTPKSQLPSVLRNVPGPAGAFAKVPEYSALAGLLSCRTTYHVCGVRVSPDATETDRLPANEDATVLDDEPIISSELALLVFAKMSTASVELAAICKSPRTVSVWVLVAPGNPAPADTAKLPGSGAAAILALTGGVGMIEGVLALLMTPVVASVLLCTSTMPPLLRFRPI